MKLPPESGGGYLAQFEVTHQLHCLNMLWQYSWFDYYRDKKVMWSDPPEIYRQHMGQSPEPLLAEFSRKSNVLY